jgi:hypothetical protein
MSNEKLSCRNIQRLKNNKIKFPKILLFRSHRFNSFKKSKNKNWNHYKIKLIIMNLIEN